MTNNTYRVFIRASKSIRLFIKEKCGFMLKDYLLEQAFTRVSFTRESGAYNNEMLEWLGDSVINYYTSKKIIEHYGTCNCDEDCCGFVCRGHEKDFTNVKSRIVSNKTLAEIIDSWVLSNGEPINKYLIIGRSDILNNVCETEKAKADLLEAIIGAIAVQCNHNPETLEKVVSSVISFDAYFQAIDKDVPRIEGVQLDKAINTLKELAEHEQLPFPKYVFAGPDQIGYDKNGSPRWVCTCRIDELGMVKQVWGHSKTETKKYAAYLILCEHFRLANEYGPSKSLIGWYIVDGKVTTKQPEDF